MSVTTVLVLAAGTYLLRLAGPLLRGRIEVSERARQLLATAATTLLTALLFTAALTEAGGFAGWARPAGVAVGAVLAWRRAPFVVVVIAAALTAAGLRLLGIP
ncbi:MULTISPECIES: AzlD domain-containing protein [Actinoalloteichus]|uniref:Branched-chain amino acid transport protein (AzlD) n=1 Tax=Actinoalloteichus fjordicus TaxID=1612552 RepID=A0AAC9PRD9_9PSEU|nr:MULTISPECIES: AzlD domain-containing protein [Actinoalloteichus]APU14224.1 Branched-chain amino acid transport protein (AzlD) [Actinoalloteichus fjordicus]APU20193.1 Branched-chain amino acid transport protein (AzlD) [Actinoalloteichus sp. GBA129-24]